MRMVFTYHVPKQLVSGVCRAAMLAALAVSAARAAELPAPMYADQETFLDIPLGEAFSPEGATGTARVALVFDAAPSNNVQFALGRDAPPVDGKLDMREAAFIAGWDRGCFFLRPRGLEDRFEIPAAPGGRRTLAFSARRTAEGGFADIAFTVDGKALAFPLPPSPDWLRPPWDILRVTSRGTDNPDASVSVSHTPKGVTVIFK